MGEVNDNLWAPWRMEYIRSLDQEHADQGGCFFCRYFEQPQQDRGNHVIWRGRNAFAMMNRFPYTNGHLMIAAARHTGDPAELTDAESAELTRMTYDAVGVLRRVVNAQGFNIGANIGLCAGAGVPDHLHFHVVPRWNGDTNYMSVLGGVRVIPDALDALYEQIVTVTVELGLRRSSVD